MQQMLTCHATRFGTTQSHCTSQKELEDRKNKIQSILDKINHELSIIEKIKKFIIIDSPFTIENEMLTPTMKIRRHQVKKVFGDQLEKLYF